MTISLKGLYQLCYHTMTRFKIVITHYEYGLSFLICVFQDNWIRRHLFIRCNGTKKGSKPKHTGYDFIFLISRTFDTCTTQNYYKIYDDFFSFRILETPIKLLPMYWVQDRAPFEVNLWKQLTKWFNCTACLSQTLYIQKI